MYNIETKVNFQQGHLYNVVLEILITEDSSQDNLLSLTLPLQDRGSSNTAVLNAKTSGQFGQTCASYF
uniref:Uncharacterized protein n=1 Tax=Kangiella spongicola TaxID=796379 RepID=A0A318D533_9GAMM